VDDVIVATEYLRAQPHVDPDRIYLGGHSTGGTLVQLVAASSDQYRAVFSFGPMDDVGGYGRSMCHVTRKT
jgi:dipeptidyl aminopeptidase/acylaminoacyl peptidase